MLLRSKLDVGATYAQQGELDLGAMEKYYSHPKFPDNIPPDAYSTDVNKYVLLYQIG
ncbi:MAG: hypothetical protein V9E90_12545 [Saprospiraceae bacterium]|jgi:hypothetical protein